MINVNLYFYTICFRALSISLQTYDTEEYCCYQKTMIIKSQGWAHVPPHESLVREFPEAPKTTWAVYLLLVVCDN